MSCALGLVNPATQVKVNIHHPAVRGSKTGLMMRRPFVFCCVVGCTGLFYRGNVTAQA